MKPLSPICRAQTLSLSQTPHRQNRPDLFVCLFDQGRWMLPCRRRDGLAAFLAGFAPRSSGLHGEAAWCFHVRQCAHVFTAWARTSRALGHARRLPHHRLAQRCILFQVSRFRARCCHALRRHRRRKRNFLRAVLNWWWIEVQASIFSRGPDARYLKSGGDKRSFARWLFQRRTRGVTV